MDDLSYDDMRVTLATWTRRQTMTPRGRHDIAGLFEAVIARAEAAEARAAELQAALAAERAAHQWRPVSQKPMHTLRYQVVLQHGQRFPAVDHVVYDAMSGWASPDAIYWRPIPPLPPAPPQEPPP